ncbi:hypothetical protein ACIQXQ_11390 [Peribacillus sp. NPDC097198]|uniref:hypothetical protein n=1 Tax=Peribacillus sp. NPDC097198 TaxID=3364397 RepID=UPI0038127046
MAVAVPQNWKSNIAQVVKGYETEPAKGLIHGLQKDFVQNSWGQRVDLVRGKGWGMQFKVINNLTGQFLTIHDFGTHGLTGANLTMDDISNLTDNLDPSYRLARFSAMNYSGGNEGAGLFGRGKLIFSAASKRNYYIYESLSKDGYRVNFKILEGNTLNLAPKAYEGENAKRFLKKETGLKPIKKNGTRIIIIDPIDKLVDAINSGLFMKHIEETWWPIIGKYQAKIEVIDSASKNKKAKVPQEYSTENLISHKTIDNVQLPGFSKIRKLHFGISKSTISEDLLGVYLYRKNMKMGEVPLNIPEEIKDRLFGYIEVDEDFEKHIETIENLEHYGFTNKRTNVFQSLKLAVSNEYEIFMEEEGYINKKVAEDDLMQNELIEVAGELDSLLNDIDLSNGDSGKKSESKFSLKWHGMSFPIDKANYLNFGDEVTDITFGITNKYSTPKKFKVNLTIKCEKNTIVSIFSDEVRIENGENFLSPPFNFKISNDFIPEKKHSIVLTVSPPGSLKEEQIEATFYYDMERRVSETRDFSLKLETIDLPNNQSRRVNTGEIIKNISYKISNNSPHMASLGLNVSTYMAQRPKTFLETSCHHKFVLPPHTEIIIPCSDIELTKDLYENIMLKGPIEIQAILSATDKLDKYEVSEIICKNPPLLVYLNQEDGFINQTFSTVQMLEGDDYRSWVSGTQGNWSFSLYKDHPLYAKIANNEEQRKEYIIEEMLKQTIYVHLAEGNTTILAMFSDDMSEIEELSEAALLQHANAVVDKIQLKRNLN